ncbi:hypothetical protein pb186bvf_019279 [Paramecium bursaria]
MIRLNQLSSQIQYQKVEVEKLEQDQIGIVYMNSPKDLNCLSAQMKKELISALKQFDNDNDIKVIVLLSKLAKVFCAGADIKDFLSSSLQTQLLNDLFKDIHDEVSGLKKPLIVGVNGFAFGGGFEISLLADIIVGTENTKFGLPELNLGIIPGIGGTQRLSRLIGRTNAQRYILTGDTIDSQEAYKYGIINVLVKSEELKDKCIELARKISSKSLYTLMVAKQSINLAEETTLHSGSKMERFLIKNLILRKFEIKNNYLIKKNKIKYNIKN